MQLHKSYHKALEYEGSFVVTMWHYECEKKKKCRWPNVTCCQLITLNPSCYPQSIFELRSRSTQTLQCCVTMWQYRAWCLWTAVSALLVQAVREAYLPKTDLFIRPSALLQIWSSHKRKQFWQDKLHGRPSTNACEAEDRLNGAILFTSLLYNCINIKLILSCTWVGITTLNEQIYFWADHRIQQS